MAFTPFLPTYTPEPVRCSGGPTSGALVLQDWACSESPWARHLFDVGIYACRDVYGGWCPNCNRRALSAHSSGRSGDSGHTIVNNASHPAGVEFANWLVANAGVLGVQEVISNRRRWDNQSKRWKAYKGRSPHTDHVHWTLNAQGARYLTLARIESVAPRPEPPPDPIPLPQEDDDVRYLVTTTTGPLRGRWYITDSITKRWVTDRADATVQVNSGLVKANGKNAQGEPVPYTWPQAAVEGPKDA